MLATPGAFKSFPPSLIKKISKATGVELTAQASRGAITNALRASFTKEQDRGVDTSTARGSLLWAFNCGGRSDYRDVLYNQGHATQTVHEALAEYSTNIFSFFGPNPVAFLLSVVDWIDDGNELKLVLIDTINFITTGRRYYPLHELEALLSNGKEYGTWEREYPTLKVINSIDDYTSTELFERWISRPHGVRDLMYIHGLLFRD